LLPEAGYRHLAAALALVLGLLPSPGHGATFHYQAFLAGLEVGTAQLEVELDLRRYTESFTQHEDIRFLRGLDPGMLPDRWHGFGALQAFMQIIPKR